MVIVRCSRIIWPSFHLLPAASEATSARNNVTGALRSAFPPYPGKERESSSNSPNRQ